MNVVNDLNVRNDDGNVGIFFFVPETSSKRVGRRVFISNGTIKNNNFDRRPPPQVRRNPVSSRDHVRRRNSPVRKRLFFTSSLFPTHRAGQCHRYPRPGPLYTYPRIRPIHPVNIGVVNANRSPDRIITVRPIGYVNSGLWPS